MTDAVTISVTDIASPAFQESPEPGHSLNKLIREGRKMAASILSGFCLPYSTDFSEDDAGHAQKIIGAYARHITKPRPLNAGQHEIVQDILCSPTVRGEDDTERKSRRLEIASRVIALSELAGIPGSKEIIPDFPASSLEMTEARSHILLQLELFAREAQRLVIFNSRESGFHRPEIIAQMANAKISAMAG